LFEPHYVFWQCEHCDKRYVERDCYGGGKYCAVEPSNDKIAGHEIVDEDLRQKCLWNVLKADKENENATDLWWDYIARVHSHCYNVINEDCSKRAFEHLEISWEKTQKCIDDSFSSKDRTSPTTTNKLIDDEIKYWRDYGTNIYPSVVINKKTFRG